MSRPSGSTVSGSPLWRVWIAAVLFHVPGLRLFTTVPVTRRLVVPNVAAVALTVLAASSAAWLLGLLAGLAALLVGHFAWGVTLASMAARDRDAVTTSARP